MKIGWCQLINNPVTKKDDGTMIQYDSRIAIIENLLQSFYNIDGNDTYNFDLFSLLRTVIAKLPNPFNTSHMYFCSELVTKIYEILNIISPIFIK